MTCNVNHAQSCCYLVASACLVEMKPFLYMNSFALIYFVVLCCQGVVIADTLGICLNDLLDSNCWEWPYDYLCLKGV